MKKGRSKGFTLVELAIVLAVSALLFAGLWRLFSGGNTQLRDQAAADQMRQLGQAVQGFLASSQGRARLTDLAANASVRIPLPTANTSNAVCKASNMGQGSPTADFSDLCDFLPPGFIAATTNSYGQTYTIRALKDSQLVNVAPVTYSFLILTQGGDVVPDSSGARIAGNIGNDGGFIYSQNVCGAPAAYVCGAYGSWQTRPVADYNFNASPGSGRLGLRYASAGASVLTDPWLARKDIGGPPRVLDYVFGADSNPPGTSSRPEYSVIQSDIAYAVDPTRTYTFDFGRTDVFNRGRMVLFQKNDLPALLVAADPTNIVGAGSTDCTDYTDTNAPTVCNAALQVNGSANVSGLLQALVLYADSFIYQTSDRRFKTDIKPIASPLEKLSAIQGVQFTMKDDSQHKVKYGVIAQDVEKVYPEIVGGSEDHKTVDYMGLVGPIIGAVNELKAENDALRKQIKAQAAAIKKLEKAQGE